MSAAGVADLGKKLRTIVTTSPLSNFFRPALKAGVQPGEPRPVFNPVGGWVVRVRNRPVDQVFPAVSTEYSVTEARHASFARRRMVAIPQQIADIGRAIEFATNIALFKSRRNAWLALRLQADGQHGL